MAANWYINVVKLQSYIFRNILGRMRTKLKYIRGQDQYLMSNNFYYFPCHVLYISLLILVQFRRFHISIRNVRFRNKEESYTPLAALRDAALFGGQKNIFVLPILMQEKFFCFVLQIVLLCFDVDVTCKGLLCRWRMHMYSLLLSLCYKNVKIQKISKLYSQKISKSPFLKLEDNRL